ncbi:Mce family protein Mce5B [Mycobacteroides abscessus subsp. abscessus]|uniref:MCE family protein n=1 Tax=Mycobacteroides abscessus TaxID=36809 RepID=UPI00092C5E07|nr:MCE family protein [Mycobacteroides abscessus]MBN7437890.1 MCE family protein [Mycobacteroides abscessus subsp. abscessus]MDM1888403.1 MCE family protein [Mycobacteroides abscessus]MDM1893175.1 MCE family protein [Mycobacteroides abscessus]MDO3110975.1 MCE family protein [Mycobacteroides abscessus subsp. abscessus]RIS00110.1 MCE family protein [Mycobacteroides abscessus]
MSFGKPLIGLSLFMAAAIFASWMVYSTLRQDVQGATATFSAVFTDVMGLQPGNDVRIAGVRVGRVDAIDLQDFHAKVTFRVQRDQMLFTDTTAAVTYQNIIGQRYLSLAAGTTPGHRVLDGGGQIPLGHTTASFDVSGLLNGYEPLFTLLDPQQVDNLTNGIVQALQGDSGALLTLITETSQLAQSLAGPDQVLGDLIAQITDVTTNLANQDAALQAVLRQTRDIMAIFADRRAALLESARSITEALGRLAEITDNVSPDLRAFIDREPGIMAHLSGEGRDRFAYMGSNLPALLKGLARVSQEGSYVNAYACNVNVTLFAFLGRLIPSVVEHATPGGKIQQTAICR